ncbi:MAG: pseudouridine synthase [Lachnospiraceae bacterium]|nr:pseudouridine synthase [Lachnospiraceae bacterium]
MIRLDKFLTETNMGSRSQSKLLIRKGRVTVDGTPVKNPELKIAETAVVTVDGVKVSYQKYVYYMLHKPGGVISATEDSREKTVLELLQPLPVRDLFPVGRLDKDTEGLLLITNDGQLAHRLLSPKKHVAKTYYVKAMGAVEENDVRLFQEGLDIGDEKPTLPAKLQILKSGESSECLITVTEGRYHQVKRMFLKIGKPVVYLKRLTMGSLQLDEKLAPGAYRPLTQEEIQLLLS